MHTIESLLNKPWHLYQIFNQGDQTLALENSFIRYLPQLHKDHPESTENIIVHWYPIPEPTILLGAKDTRLPQIHSAVKFLQESGYKVVVRPHGGMAIVCDPGVLNFSLVQDMGSQSLNIEAAYQQFIEWIQLLFQAYGLKVQSYEMVDSYCPGKYDIIVNGKKIGGTAQRRFKSGLTTAAYLSINGDQVQRAQVVKDFYRVGQADDSYPSIDVHCMTSLAQELGRDISLDDFYQQMLQTIQTYTDIQTHQSMPEAMLSSYDKSLLQIQERTLSVTQS